MVQSQERSKREVKEQKDMPTTLKGRQSLPSIGSEPRKDEAQGEKKDGKGEGREEKR